MGDYKKIVHMLTFLLLIIGGINWLLVGAVQWDIGEVFGGQNNMISRAIYILVGLSAVYAVAMHKGDCNMCAVKGGKNEGSMPPSSNQEG